MLLLYRHKSPVFLCVALLSFVATKPTSVVYAHPRQLDYYVSPAGNDRFDGSRAHPWATLNHASGLARPGWIIHVAPGVYPGPVTTSSSGTPTARIRYISDTKWGATIRCASETPCNYVWRQNGNYVDVLGFELTSHNMATRLGIIWCGSYGLIHGNKIHAIEAVRSGSNGGAAISVASQWGWNADYTVVDSNLIYDIGIAGADWRIQGIYPSGAQRLIISNNVIANVYGWGVHLYHGNVSHNTIVNNTIVASGGGIEIGSDAPVADYNFVANNIVAWCRLKGGITECCNNGDVGTHNSYINNLFYQNSPADVVWQSGSRSVNGGAVYGNPHFVNYQPDGSGDYRLTGASPALERGSALNAPDHDFYGGKRPVNSHPDIGAHEFASDAASWPWN